MDSGFENHVIMYSKGLYGRSEKGFAEDLIVLLNRYIGGDFGTIQDIQHYILNAFNKYVDELQRYEALREALGWSFHKIYNFNRKPEECMMGKLSILHKEYVDLFSRYSDIFFGSDEEKIRINELVEQWKLNKIEHVA
jgi:hypothetical protein